MRVILFGYYGFGNSGDEAVLAGLLHGLRQFGPSDVEYLVLSGNPKQTETLHGVPAKPRNDWRTLVREASAADLWIFGGGSLLQNVTGPLTLPYYLGVMRLIRLRGSRFALHAQGVGPIAGRVSRRMTGSAVKRAARISVRDSASKETLVALGIPAAAVHMGADLAFLLPAPKADQSVGPRGQVAVAVREWGETDRWLPQLLEGLRHFLAEAGAEAIVVPMDTADEPLARRIAGELGAGAMATDGDAPYTEKKRLLAGCSLVLAMRLHAGVLASLEHVPSVFLAYDPKVTAMAERLGAPVLTMDEITVPRVYRVLQDAWDGRRGQAKALALTVGKLREEAEEDIRGLVHSLFSPRATGEELSRE